MSDLRTVAETAALLRVSSRTVYRLVRDRKIKLTKVRGSSFVTEAEIARYLRTAERAPRVA